MDTLLTRRLMMMAGGSPVPPIPTMIPYIRGGAGGSYIDTGITPDETTRIIVWARNFNPGACPLIGAQTAANGTSMLISTYTQANLGKIRVDYGSTIYYSNEDFTKLSHYHKYELYQGELKVDDTIVAATSDTIFSIQYNLFLFGLNRAGSLVKILKPVDICACKIYKNGTLVRDFIPTNNPVVGLYDSVSGTIFTNSGSGSFTYGEFETSSYTPLQYTESSGAQYFDTGIKGSNSLDYVIKVRPNVSTAWPDIFFAQTSNSSKRYGLAMGNNSTPGRVVFFTYNTSNLSYTHTGTLNGTDFIVSKETAKHYLYINSAQKSSQTFTAASFTTDYNIYVFAGNIAGTVDYYFTGRIYYLGFGTSRNFVPAKVNNIAGMYDTYNDVFYASSTSTPFIAGPAL